MKDAVFHYISSGAVGMDLGVYMRHSGPIPRDSQSPRRSPVDLCAPV